MKKQPKETENVGLPMNEDEQIPVGIRAMMTATNSLHGSF